MIIVLDTFPASSISKPPGAKPTLSDTCRQWVYDCESAGHLILVPAVAYFEALRELELRRAVVQIARLRQFCLLPQRFMPITTAHLETAAQLWANSRRSGNPTASREALDADVIIAAQTLSMGLPASDYIVATTNVTHLSRFVHCEVWSNIPVSS